METLNITSNKGNMAWRIWNWVGRPSDKLSSIIDRRRAQLLSYMLFLVLALLSVRILVIVFTIGWREQESLIIFASYIVMALAYILSRTSQYKLGAGLFIGVLATLALSTAFTRDPTDLRVAIALVWIAHAIVISGIFFSFREAVWTSIVLNASYLSLPFFIPEIPLTTIFASLGIIGSLTALVLVFKKHREVIEKEVNDVLRSSEAELEKRVANRTRDLAIAGEVARQITKVLDLQELLNRLVNKTKDGFSLYFVLITLYDADSRQLKASAGTGDIGRQLTETATSMHIQTPQNLIAQAARERTFIVVNDIEQEPNHFRTNGLPEAQSEMTLPLLVGETLIGVLDLQSISKNFFTADNISIFSTLAEQIAIAINNAKLYAKQQQLSQELRQADVTKTQFLASMSHELRTPLNGIMNFTEMVSSGMMGDINEEQKDLLDQSLDSSTHLLSLINDVLDITKIQADKLTLFVEGNVDPHEELNGVINLIEPMIADRSVSLVEDIDENLPLMQVDKRRLRQILLNLASNAVKFTQEGTITISAKNRTDHILLAVSDTGPGISDEMQEIIFEPFIQTVDGIKHAQGTGLGLPITKSLVEAHGGRLWLESKLGEGTAFFVSLPVIVTTSVVTEKLEALTK